MIFSISIPVYNRRHLLERQLLHLEDLDFDKKEFEVIIVDDGSSDSTDAFMREYIPGSQLQIIYHKKENGGKFTALNYAINIARGKFFINTDSDDYLDKNCLKKFYELWSGIDYESKNIAGIIGNNFEMKTGKLLGKAFPYDNYISDPIEMRFKYGVSSDKIPCIRTEIMKQYRFPDTDKTKFIPESYIYYGICADNYSFLYVNECFQWCEYQQDGLTGKIQNYRINNSYGCFLVYEKYVTSIPAKKSCKAYIRNAINYIRFGLHAKEKVSVKNPLIFMLYPLGLAAYCKDRFFLKP